MHQCFILSSSRLLLPLSKHHLHSSPAALSIPHFFHSLQQGVIAVKRICQYSQGSSCQWQHVFCQASPPQAVILSLFLHIKTSH